MPKVSLVNDAHASRACCGYCDIQIYGDIDPRIDSVRFGVLAESERRSVYCSEACFTNDYPERRD